MSLFPPAPHRPQNVLYNQVPDGAPMPRVWYSLGQVHPGLEAHYAADVEMDINRAAELKQEAANISLRIANDGHDVNGMVLSRTGTLTWPWLLIRFYVAEPMDQFAARN